MGSDKMTSSRSSGPDLRVEGKATLKDVRLDPGSATVMSQDELSEMTVSFVSPPFEFSHR